MRKICPNCKTEYEPPAGIRKVIEKLNIEIPKYYRGVGCKKCRNTGYVGRIAIHELFVPDKELTEMINDGVNLKKLREKALKNGMTCLQADGLEKVKAEIISVEEVLRMTEGMDN